VDVVFKRIVLAVDGSPPSERAVSVCADLAASLGAEVAVIHVNIDPVMIMPPVAPTEAMIAPPVLTDQALREADAAGQAILARALDALRTRSVKATARQARGPVGQRVVEAANELSADLIVLGSHGHGRLEELLLGSVSDAVARHARCSVLIVR
jgi:nucleotide-binding universal stress UspA family protein